MADIFISYKSERRNAARHLAKTLACWGFDVWYDYGLIPGEDYEARLLREMESARVIVVLWCEKAVLSHWVKKEASFARSRGAYVPCAIQAVSLPPEFADADTINLADWSGSPRSSLLDRLVTTIAERIGREPTLSFSALRELEETWLGMGSPRLAQFAAEAPPEGRREPLFQEDSDPNSKARAEVIALQRRAETNDPEAEFELADRFRHGKSGLTRDEIEAVKLYRRAAEHGKLRAWWELSLMLLWGSTDLKRDEAEAARLMKIGADAGDALARKYLGDWHAKGENGLPRDFSLAVHYYTLAARPPPRFGARALAELYEQGADGVPINSQQAVHYYELASRGGDHEATFALAKRYEFGTHGIKKNLREAVRLYRICAEHFDSSAKGRLAQFYLSGKGGVRKDEREAVRLLKQDSASPSSLVTLGQLHERGRGGLRKDCDAAMRCYEFAAKLGSTDATERLRRLSRQT